MPWTSAQHRLFQAAAHNQRIAAKHGLSQRQAARMASEGIKPTAKHYAKALRKS